MLRWLRGTQPTLVDGLLAVGVAGLNAWEMLARVDDGVVAGGRTASIIVLVLFSLPLVGRRRRPVTCWFLMHGEFLLAGLFVEHAVFAFGTLIPSCLMTFSVARRGARPWARWSWLSGLLLWAGVLLADGRTSKTLAAGGLMLVTAGASWGSGWLLRRLAERESVLQDARDRLLREREQRQAEAAQQERLRIALEMNGVVTTLVEEMVTRLTAQAEELGYAGADVSRLLSAGEAGRQALADLRSTLGVGPRDTGLDVHVPTLVDASQLVAHFRDAGLDVTWEGPPAQALPPAVSSVAYRVLQEALTNALKHGGARACATVELRGRDAVVVVRNDLRPSAAHASKLSGRHGLKGMRARVAALGGSFEAGVKGNGFVVHAVLPARQQVQA